MAELTKLEDKLGEVLGLAQAAQDASMAEAGKVAHVEILGTLAQTPQDAAVVHLAAWALPIQERHLASVRESGVRLAAAEDPDEPA